MQIPTIEEVEQLYFREFIRRIASRIFLMIRPPTGCTLFPYTTLFRSPVAVHAEPHHDRSGGDDAVRLVPRRPGDERDRKSTRLNSSHVENSYAVFCLKKKKFIGVFVSNDANAYHIINQQQSTALDALI